jgi:hypothetical protein
MINLLKKYYEAFLIVSSIIFISLTILFFVKIVSFLTVNFEKVIGTSEIPKSSIEFNIGDAVSILKKRNLIQQ